jgi:acetoin utilization protein AcuB
VSMHEHGINGLPVADEDNRVVGVIGIKDILRVPFHSGNEVYISTATHLPRLAAHRRDLQVRGVIAVRPLCMRPDDSLSVAGEPMVNRGVHPIPVVDDDRRHVEVIGRADILGVRLSTDRAQSGAALGGHG